MADGGGEGLVIVIISENPHLGRDLDFEFSGHGIGPGPFFRTLVFQTFLNKSWGSCGTILGRIGRAENSHTIFENRVSDFPTTTPHLHL